LRHIGDLERILTRIALKTARPRDLAVLREGLRRLPALRAGLAPLDSPLLQRLQAALELTELEARERQRTGIPTLKVGYNRVHGYYIEISRAHSERAPEDYIRRQTLKGAERFITPELKAFEEKVLSARERAHVLCALAERALTLDLTCPELRDEPGIHIEAGRHPVVERVQETPFVPNDLILDDERRMLVVTGPNMGGKSTYMRQNALICLLAHMGAFVPARRAVIGPIDRIFTRIGAADDLASGRSTFMVEMTETAHILHHATEHSLVLMDEVGRGTSTYDGLALAWAAAEHLVARRAFTLFATHYFELTELAERHPTVANVHLGAREHGQRIVFLHNVEPAARDHLARLEAERERHAPQQPQLPLFAPPTEPPPDPLREALAKIDPDDLTPRQALEHLYRLKDLARKPAGGYN